MTPDNLRATRQRLRLTQAELAEYLGVARNTVTRWEAGTLRLARPQMIAALLREVERQRSRQMR